MEYFRDFLEIPFKFEGHCYVEDHRAEFWLIKGRTKHRLDGPAKIYKSGTVQWWVNGKLHRLDGPAIKYSNGRADYSINGEFYDKENYWNHPLVIESKLNQIIKL